MYSVVDIESSGGKYGAEKIIEIAIYKTDGYKILDQFTSFVNPQKNIDPYVVRLTSITDKMVRTAPKFSELAKRVVEITENTILVGHNVPFDYRMLRQEFSYLGYDYQKSTLDTLDLCQNLLPGHEAYGLEKITKALGIPNLSRHRASGDAMATYDLLKILLKKDTSNKAIHHHTKEPQGRMAKNRLLKLQNQIKELPLSVGLFYFYDVDESIIYTDVALHLRNKVNQFLVKQIAKESQRSMLESIASIGYTLTGNFIIAKIKAYNLIKRSEPLFNKEKKKPIMFGIAISHDDDGFPYFRIIKRRFREQESLVLFSELKQMKQFLSKLSVKYDLCPKINGTQCTNEECSQESSCYQLVISKGIDAYKQNFSNALDFLDFSGGDFILEEEGCEKGEKSFIWIENKKIKAYGYYNFDHQIKKKSVLENLMVEADTNDEIKSLVLNVLLQENTKTITLEKV